MYAGTGFEVYQYRYVGLTLTGFDVERVLSACPRGEALVENCSRRARVECTGSLICIDSTCFSRPSSLKRDMVYFVHGGELVPVEARDGGYLRLRVVRDCTHATLEINGVHMHRVEGVTPWEDTLAKVRAARVSRNHVVLDTCMGLGYTAIASLLRGARLVVTFEVDERVVWAAERNPHSRLLDSPGIVIIHGDVARGVERLPSGVFDRVIHDPPRLMESTGELYSLHFYTHLYRVLKPGGILFHYTGRPRGGRILQGVARRLQQAGFTRVRWVEDALGFVAYKPRA